MKKITFEEWIDREGVIQIAKLLNVKPMTVRWWRQGACNPRTECMRRIKRFTRGEIDYEQMIERPLNTLRF